MGVKFEYNGKLSNGRRWDLDSMKRISVEIEDDDLDVWDKQVWLLSKQLLYLNIKEIIK